jgi:aryl-alcohol dehydrogenase-like predicted oxidoreductase
MKRVLGRSGIEISAMGLGCWAIGGVQYRAGEACGWAGTNDAESIRAINTGIDLGINFIDTADMYGGGHSEEVIAKAIKGKRDQLVIASKFGYTFTEGTTEALAEQADPDYIRSCCEKSLKRLQTDRIDLYQFHLGAYDLDKAQEIRDTLEELIKTGKIRSYGWSTDDTDKAEFFAKGEHCTAIQQRLNILEGNLDTLKVCEDNNLASINKGPLAMGILTGKFNTDSKLPDDDVRCGWNFKTGTQADALKKLDAIREILTTDERTLAQGALAWLWAISKNTIPIPGFKTVDQVKENAKAMQKGPLTKDQMEDIETLLK